jgi:hypothetical protein
MAYVPTYTETDVAPAVIDGLVKVFVGVAIFATLIGLAVGLTFAWGLSKKLMRK